MAIPTHRTALSADEIRLLIQHRRFEIVRYGPEYRVRPRAIARRMASRARYAVRGMVGAWLNAIYRLDILYDPVVTIVLRRTID